MTQYSRVETRAALLDIKGLDLWFGGTHAIDNVDMSVEKGEILGVIGPNGAGKSSALNCINGFYRPQAGSVQFRGHELTTIRPHSIATMGIARTFQNIELSPGETVMQNVMVGRHIHMRTGVVREMIWIGPGRREESRHRAHVEDIVCSLGLGAFLNRPVADLPYGKQKLVELARSLAMEPELLLLDEPTAGMTREERAEVAVQIRRLKTETGLTQVLIEHDAGFIRSLCDRVVVLDHGAVIASGSATEVMADPKVVEAYLGVEPEDVEETDHQ